jgi:glycosyltransferase involved in cell wall biosynthesis
VTFTTAGVSVVAVVRDEERTLGPMLHSVLSQDHSGPLEIVLAVGPSRDATLRVAREWAALDRRVRLVDNPTGGRAEGLNAALAASCADFEIVVRVDGHAVLPPDYLRRALVGLDRTGAVNVGGMMVPVGVGATQRAVACAMSHPAGIGSEAFHTGGEAGPASTVYLGAFRRSALLAAGGYDRSLVRGEDWDLNRRLRERGGVVWFDPTLRVGYYPRASLRAVATQFLRTGMWRREIISRDLRTVTPRYLAAPALVLGLALSPVLGVAVALAGASWWWLALLVPGLYVPALLGAAVHAGRGQGLAVIVRLPVVLAVMHVSWGAGFLRGVTPAARREHRA